MNRHFSSSLERARRPKNLTTESIACVHPPVKLRRGRRGRRGRHEVDSGAILSTKTGMAAQPIDAYCSQIEPQNRFRAVGFCGPKYANPLHKRHDVAPTRFPGGCHISRLIGMISKSKDRGPYSRRSSPHLRSSVKMSPITLAGPKYHNERAGAGMGVSTTLKVILTTTGTF